MKQNIVRLTENQLKQLINESVKRVMNEWTDIMAFPKEFLAKKDRQWKEERLKKEAEKRPDLDPAGFMWMGDVIKHNGKKRPKAAPKQVVGKPEGMSDIDYITKFAPKYNKRLEKGLERMREYADGEEEKWVELNVGHLRSGDVAQEFSDRYYISNFGGIALSNPTNTSNCHVFCPYFDKSTRQFQINLRIYDDDGNESDHLCPAVVSLVRQAFGDEAASRLKAFEKMKLRDGGAITSGEETDF